MRTCFLLIGVLPSVFVVACQCSDKFNHKDGEITSEVLERYARRDVVYTDSATWDRLPVDDITCADLCRYTFYPGYLQSIDITECTTDFTIETYDAQAEPTDEVLGMITCKGKVEFRCN